MLQSLLYVNLPRKTPIEIFLLSRIASICKLYPLDCHNPIVIKIVALINLAEAT